VAVYAQVRKLTDVSHESICILGVVPRVWVEVTAHIVIDVVIIHLGVVPSCNERFGIALFEVEVVLHSLQRCVVDPFLCFFVVLIEAVTFCFAWCSVTTKFASDNSELYLLNTSFGIEEGSCKTLWLSTIERVPNEVEAMYTHCGAIFRIGAALLTCNQMRGLWFGMLRNKIVT
jgi:hypothetical protein